MRRRLAEVRLPLGHPPEALRQAVLARLSIGDAALLGVEVVRRGVDARKAPAIMLVYTLDLELRAAEAEASGLPVAPDTLYRPVGHAPAGLTMRPVVIGAGPCGLFAALTLAQMGFRPIVLERGQRRARNAPRIPGRLWRRGDFGRRKSNVQFGEGGAGTFSDGKLYSRHQATRCHHRPSGSVSEFVAAGAPEEITVPSVSRISAPSGW